MNSETATKPQPAPDRTERRWLTWILVAGIALALLPHVVRLVSTGDPTWVCDTDELVPYGHLISQAYHQHPWRLGDPALPSGGASMYPWIQFGPWVALGRLLGVGPTGVLGLMRLFAGISVGLGAWLLCRRQGHPRATALLALLVITDQGLVADHGMKGGIPLLHHWRTLFGIVSGHPSEEVHQWAAVLSQFRLITPGMSFLSLAAALFTLVRLRETWDRRHVILAGLAFGYCIATYLYFWTAVACAIACLATIERTRWRAYMGVVIIGGIVGSPALIQNMVTKAAYGDEWLVRNEYFLRLASVEVELPKRFLLIYAALAVPVWLWLRRLAPLWFAGVAALALSVSHIVTHVYLQPWHWFSVSGPIATVIALHAIAEAWQRWAPKAQWTTVALGALGAAQLASAAYLRTWATDHNRESARVEAGRQQWLAFRRAAPGARLEPNSVIAGDITATDWAVLLEGVRPLTSAVGLSPSVKNEEWMRRRVLNAFLKGAGPDQVAESAHGDYGVWFQVGRLTPAQLERELAAFRSVWEELAVDPNPDIERFGVRHLLLRSSAVPPRQIREGWTLQADAAGWQLWKRNP